MYILVHIIVKKSPIIIGKNCSKEFAVWKSKIVQTNIDDNNETFESNEIL
jgi:hypothetical protein